MKIIADRLRLLRKRKNRKQAEIAAALGIPPTTYSNWEQDKADPPVSMLPKLAAYYQCTTDHLLGLDAKAGESAIADKINALPEDSRQAVLRLIEAMHKDH